MAKKKDKKEKTFLLLVDDIMQRYGKNKEIALQKALEETLNPFLLQKIFPNKEQRGLYQEYVLPVSFRKGIHYPEKGRYQIELVPNNGNNDYFFDPETEKEIRVKGLLREMKKRKEKGVGIAISDFFEFITKNPNPHIDQVDSTGRGRNWSASCVVRETKENKEIEVTRIRFKQTYWKATSIIRKSL